ncbi:MYND finger domain-containing protein [Hirsutella rhossiliensis]
MGTKTEVETNKTKTEGESKERKQAVAPGTNACKKRKREKKQEGKYSDDNGEQKRLPSYRSSSYENNYSMATCNVSVEFWCEFGATELKYKHSIPKTLVTQVGQARPNHEASALFLQWIRPILREHEAACRKAAGARCESCGEVAKEILQSPISYLHAEAVCARGRVVILRSEGCEIRARQEMQDTMAEAGEGGGRMGAKQKQGEGLPGLWRDGGARRCSRCQAVAYCSRQHQRRTGSQRQARELVRGSKQRRRGGLKASLTRRNGPCRTNRRFRRPSRNYRAPSPLNATEVRRQAGKRREWRNAWDINKVTENV